MTLKYKTSIRNVIVGVLFIELVLPPVYVVAAQLYCPVGIKP